MIVTAETETCRRLLGLIPESVITDIDGISPDDELTLCLFQGGRTTGLPVFERAGMQSILKEVHPASFNDLVILFALSHPGPSAFIGPIFSRRNNKENICYGIPALKEHLEDTYGMIIYQEQVIDIARVLAGFTSDQCSMLRKALLDHTDRETREDMGHMFIEGGKNRGYTESVLSRIWADIDSYKYHFKKSYAVTVVGLIYQLAYLKAHHPCEFMAALLVDNGRRQPYTQDLLNECLSMGLRLLPPDVNYSDTVFSASDGCSIRFGLSNIKGVDHDAAAEIIRVREDGGRFTDVFDFVQRVNRSLCGKDVLWSLAKIGAFGCFGLPREHYLGRTRSGVSSIDIIFGYAPEADSTLLFQLETPELPARRTLTDDEIRRIEEELLGTDLAHDLSAGSPKA